MTHASAQLVLLIPVSHSSARCGRSESNSIRYCGSDRRTGLSQLVSIDVSRTVKAVQLSQCGSRDRVSTVDRKFVIERNISSA